MKAKKEIIKVFGFKVRNPATGEYLGKWGWTSRGKVWTRKFDAINAIKSQMASMKYHSDGSQEEALTWEFVELGEIGTSSVLFVLEKLSS
jgi:hypothetical protein